MTSNVPVKDRCYEDFSIGESFILGSVEMVEEEMLAFATQFDPQRFHVDPEAAAQTMYGGLIASGWHTGSLMMRLTAEGFLGEHCLGAAGLSELSWPAPVRVGDVLTLQLGILGKRESGSKPNLGFVELSSEMINQNDEVALRTVGTMLIAKKDSSN
ncbi:MAG: MaoC family dehydratase [Acidimicrobiales bacterium]|nr:MaoC family dehydratase [Acidimicrobiales bacterium]MDP6900904.1 MaoC family dehydratase [Acidimicrobiales bacterium]HJL98398.1 MaoC family dehydratase [Acidimicrobiales bacterium]